MKKKLFIVSSALALLTGCSTEKEASSEYIFIGTPLPAQPYNKITAVVLKKRLLSHNREEYYLRLNDGREIYVRIDPPLHYNVGDEIALPS